MSESEYQREAQYADERAATATALDVGTEVAARHDEGMYKNPRFLRELRDAGLDADLTADLGPALAGAHAVAFRDTDHYEREIEWLNRNRAERDIVRNDPGSHLQDNPMALAVAQDRHLTDEFGDVPAPRPHMRSEEKEKHREALKAVTNFQSLGLDGKGLEAISKVQTSTEVNRQTEGESESKRVLKGIYR